MTAIANQCYVPFMGHHFEKSQHVEFQRGVFTTLARRRGSKIFWQDHLERLSASCRTFFLVDEFAPIQRRIERMLSHLPARGDLRLKISLYPRSDLGAKPLESASQLVLAMFWTPLPEASAGLKTVFSREQTTPNVFNIKTENYVEIFRILRQSRADDVLFLGLGGQLLRATTSNAFAILGKQLIIPDYRELGQMEGIAVRHLKKALAPHFELVTASLDYDLISSCDGLFLCNSVRGIQRVARAEAHAFKSTGLYQQLDRHWKDYLSENF